MFPVFHLVKVNLELVQRYSCKGIAFLVRFRSHDLIFRSPVIRLSVNSSYFHLFLQNLLGQFHPIFDTKHHWIKDIHFPSNDNQTVLKKIFARLVTTFWAFLIKICPMSVVVVVVVGANFSHFHLLLQNHWVNFKQTWHKASLGEGDSGLFKWRGPPLITK